MPRARNIKPGFFKNETLAEQNPLGRILFAGLWCLADREGRLEDRPKRIKAEILPYDDCDVESLLNQLARSNFILRYSIENENYIQILTFNKHQNPHMREAASVIPPYHDSEPKQHGESTVLDTENNKIGPADSFNLIPDSLNLVTDSFCSENSSPEEAPIPPLTIIFEQEFGRPLSPIEVEGIQAWEIDHAPDVIRLALKNAVMLGKYNFKYINAILLEWQKNNLRTVREVEEYQEQFKSRVLNKGQPKKVNPDKYKMLYG